jgi:hypothetical protein
MALFTPLHYLPPYLAVDAMYRDCILLSGISTRACSGKSRISGPSTPGLLRRGDIVEGLASESKSRGLHSTPCAYRRFQTN